MKRQKDHTPAARRMAGLVLAATALVLGACATDATSGDRAEEAAVVPPPVAPLAPPPPPPPPTPPPPPVAMSMPAPSGAIIVMGSRMASSPIIAPPQVTETARYEDVDLNPVKSVAQEPVSTFSIDVDTASYSNVRRFLNDGRLPNRDAVRIEEMINYFPYDYAVPASKDPPFSTSLAIVPSPWAEGRQLLHIGIQGYDVRPQERPPLNLVLLVDTSGSMSPPERLPLAKQVLSLLVDELGPQDHVSIVAYASQSGTVLEPTPGSEGAKIKAALEGLGAGGSTSGGEGLRQAYLLAERHKAEGTLSRVMIVTDFDFNVGVTDDQSLEDFIARKRETGVYLSVLGVGDDNYNESLAQKLAQNGNGVAAYIDTLAEGRKVLVEEMSRALFPIANDVKIQIEFNPARVAEYRLIGYETRLLDQADFNNDAVDAGEIMAGASVTAIYEITPVGGPTLIDPSRYAATPAPAAGAASEFAFLKLRYKLPGEENSKLVTFPVTDARVVASLDRASESTRWATAVAGFGQLLRGDTALSSSFGYPQVLALAQGARGADPFGYRAEFTQLVRAAQSAAALPAPTGTGTE
jgi:Ca-activated chloride channel family protein